jgi:hypothetical protein
MMTTNDESLVPEAWRYRVVISDGDGQRVVRAVTLAEALRLARRVHTTSAPEPAERPRS